MRTLTALATAGALLALAACGDDDNESSESTAASTDSTDAESAATTEADDMGDDSTMTVAAGEPFPDARCESNAAAGTITYLTGFDYAATASIVDVIVAEEAGYYDALCLDVEITPSFSTANYPLIAENAAQFASGGSFSEVVAFADANDADFVIVAVEGRTPIDSLIVKPGEAADLASLEGANIGVKGKLPPSIAAMLSEEGLVEGENFETVLLDGF
ncbi:MAG: ABC transporter substrate-binding protein, partial [Actinomycetota bacterium]